MLRRGRKAALLCAAAVMALPGVAAATVVGGASPTPPSPLQPIGDGGVSDPAGQLLHRTSVGLLDYSPARVDFGSVQPGATSRATTITLTAGRAPVTLASTSVSGSRAGDFELVADGCSGRTLAVGSSCAVQVGFAPALLGRSVAELRVDGDASNAPTSIKLTGEGGSTAGPARLDARLRCRARPADGVRSARLRCRVRGVDRRLAKRAHVRRMVVRHGGRIVARQRWWAMPVRRPLTARLPAGAPAGRYGVGVRLRAGKVGRRTLRASVRVGL